MLVPVGGVDGADDPALAEQARATTHRVLAGLRAWLADDRFAGSRLVLVTRGAVAPTGRPRPTCGRHRCGAWCARPDREPRPVRARRPGRRTRHSAAVLAAAVASGEPQLAVRAGQATRPASGRVPRLGGAAARPAIDPDGTVLITGGTGGARRAASPGTWSTAHGVRHLLLASRRGPAAAGRGRAARRAGRARRRGDASPPATSPTATPLAALLAAIPAEHPLTAVVHAAGVLDDGVVDVARPPTGSTRCCGPRSTPPGTCTS